LVLCGHSNQNLQAQFGSDSSTSGTQPNPGSTIKKRLLADKTLTIGCVLFLTMAFTIIYLFSSTNATVDFNVLKYFYVLIMPVTFSLFSIVFYANNAKIRKNLLRELFDSFNLLIECNE
jgi:hypothetical protein